MRKTLMFLFFTLACDALWAQQRTISGTVTDEAGDPLIGATVQVKETFSGTVTDTDGTYSIQVNLGATLVFSYTGFLTQEIDVGASNVIDVVLETNVSALDEVVVIAYGEQSRTKLVQSVATVDNRNIRDIPAVAPQELLQGQASGVQVVNSSGILGAAPVIKIRGVASISSGGRPLIVLDGVPLNDANLTAGQGGQALNPLGDINPNDIESFTVLKDAAATAVYGSRGANGVVLITTKSGRRNEATTVTVNASTSWSQSTDRVQMMNADEFRDFRVATNQAVAGNDPTTSFDWPSNVVRTGLSQDVDLSIRGGSEKTTFYVGGSIKDQQGFIVGNNLNRYSGRINLNHQANNWLNIGFNLGVTQNLNDRVGSENSTFAPMTSAFLQTPWVVPYDANGNYVNTGFIANVLAIEDLDINDSNSLRTTGNASAEVDFSSLLRGLAFQTNFGIDRVVLEEFQRSFEINSPGGFGSDYYAQQNKYVFTNTLNYNRVFNRHDLSVVVGMSYEQTDVRDISVSGTGFLSDKQLNVTSASTPGTTSNTATGSRLTGQFGRFNYFYNNRYILEGSIRRDGSSRFGQNNRYGTFWSVGGAWILSAEDFMQAVDWISSLKLRASYGTAGNDRIGDFAALENFQGGIISNYNGEAGLRQLSAANPNLQWEKSQSLNVGFEASLFNSRVTLAVDYYNKNTTDLILNVPIPQTNGGLNSIIDNVGEMVNKGVDIDLSADIVRGADFNWTASVNLGFNTNEILSLPGANVDSEGRRFVAGSTSQRAVEGFSANSFYLIRYQGVNPQTGNAEWLDIDGNPTTTPTTNDRVIAGKANPDLVGGFRNTLSYGDFDLNFFFNFSLGNDIYVSGLRFTDNPLGTFNKRAALLDRWENPGDVAFLPDSDSPTFGSFAQRSTAQLLDGSFARLKNITLGYSLPQNALDRIGFIKGLRIFFTGYNILTIKGSALEGIDPEVTDNISNIVQGETFFTPP
ncbi:MAG: TonB-dependent receptor, partial [Lewinella sp.]|nr:TonB-dependent receptor [Lewinella sp.]